MSYRTVSSQQHSVSKAELASLNAFKERFGQRPGDGKLTERLRAIAASYSAERTAILTTDMAKAIRSDVKTAAERDANGPSLRYRSLVEAKRRGIDLALLKSVQDRHYREVAALVDGDKPFSSAEVTARTVAPPFDMRPMLLPPDLGMAILYIPSFGESWERWIVNQKDGDGRILDNLSYLDAEFGVTGAKLVVQNHDAGDWNHFDVGRGNGFFVPYTMPKTGIIQVGAELICLLCRHHISTSDEWGWSDFWCRTGTALAVSVFWNHDDGAAASENLELTVAGGLEVHGDGESYPGTVIQVAPGEQRSVDFYTDVAFPAGKTVWIYAGISNRIFATLNDVSIDAWVESRWQLASLAVTTL